jgi:hypothetical protein
MAISHMKQRLLTLFLIILATPIFAQDQNYIPFGSIWKYLDDGSNQGMNWRLPTFNDSGWVAGPAELGYGDGDENTIVSYGPDSNNKYPTTYFRHTFNIPDNGVYRNFLLKLKRDDGALVYVNGQEVMRSNFSTNNYDYQAYSYTTVSSSNEPNIYQKLIDTSYFQGGSNVIAVEIHQGDAGSSDLSFDLELIALDSVPSIYRTPYLQISTPTSMVIKWNTDIKTNSRVMYGNAPGSLTNTIDSTTLRKYHEVKISGLTPNTQYYYSVGTDATQFAGDDADHYFFTSPASGNASPTKIWVLGDGGTGNYHARDVRDGYLNYTGSNEADLCILLGDNAYQHGREADFHIGAFSNMYENIWRSMPSFPSLGNHELYGEANALLQSGEHFKALALPANAEAGGLASGTESYYSFDYGNIHFVNLETYQHNLDSAGAMGTWLKNDLAATTAKWIIAYFHYPPYTKATHDSDDPADHSGRSIEVRENFNPILERYGVDLVLSGHSHAYERSFQLDGHYGFSSSLDSTMILNSGNGRLDQDGAYYKPYTNTPHSGTVYVMCGNSGKLSSPEGIHPAMYYTSNDYYGSMLIDIEDDTLTAKMIDEDAIVRDYFHIVKLNSTSVETFSNTNFTAFPNPTTGQLTIQLKRTYRSVDVSVSNMVGQLIQTQHFAGLNQIDLELKGAKGLYLVEVKTGSGEVVTFEVLKE